MSNLPSPTQNMINDLNSMIEEGKDPKDCDYFLTQDKKILNFGPKPSEVIPAGTTVESVKRCDKGGYLFYIKGAGRRLHTNYP